MTTNNKTTHGGKRPGAGAKPTKARIAALEAENAELRAEISRLQIVTNLCKNQSAEVSAEGFPVA